MKSEGPRPRFYPPTYVCLVLTFLSPDLHKVHERLGRLLETFPRIEFELPVKIMSAGEEVRSRQTPSGQA